MRKDSFTGGIFAVDDMRDINQIIFHRNLEPYSPFSAVLSLGSVLSHGFIALWEDCPKVFAGLAGVPINKLRSGDEAEIILPQYSRTAQIVVTRKIDTKNLLEKSQKLFSRVKSKFI